MEVGGIVYSKAGRDKSRPFIVIKIENGYAYLADGDLRKLNKPKKKKFMHIQPTNAVAENIKNKIENGSYLNDSDLRKALESSNKEV